MAERNSAKAKRRAPLERCSRLRRAFGRGCRRLSLSPRNEGPDSFVEVIETDFGYQLDGRDGSGNRSSAGDDETDEGVDRSGDPPANGFRQ